MSTSGTVGPKSHDPCFHVFLTEVMTFVTHCTHNPLPPSDAVWKQNFILEDFFSSVFHNLKNITPLET